MAPFNYINLDKHQAHKIDWERRDPAWDHWPSITNNLEAPTPFYDIETVFRQTFGYDLSDLIINRTALGSLGKLPTELIYHIFEAAGLHDGIILSAANGQLFVIGYPCMKAKIRNIDAMTCWGYDRIICVGELGTTLPENYLTDDEKNEIMTWSWWYDPGDEEEEPPKFEIPSKSLIEATMKDLEPEDYIDMHEYLAEIFYDYGCAMPTLDDVTCQRRRMYSFPRHIIEHPELSEDDGERLVQLQRLVVFRMGLESNTIDMALVNVSKREYIRTMDINRYVLHDVIPVLTCWGAEEEERGDWAGDRLALITWDALKVRMQEEDGWEAKTERWDPYD
ncbi:hypothetical protein AB1N83_003580 [Pleurotus pulmonarius]|nr:hypothetical protein EYR36_007968 [Pleurotus pulmonarius]